MDHSYDVAISFLSADVDLAQALADKLSKDLRVFIYTDRQEDVAGTNGLESFTQVFRSETHLAVILYRDGYGQTPWTGVERSAIEERFLAEGAEFLFILMLDDEATPLPWFPATKIRFSLPAFGVEQALGAIKARALEQGAEPHRETPAERAKRAADRIAFDQETASLERSERGVAEVRAEFASLTALLAERAEQVAAAAPVLNLSLIHI